MDYCVKSLQKVTAINSVDGSHENGIPSLRLKATDRASGKHMLILSA